MPRSIMRHVADGQLHVVTDRDGYSAPEWSFVRDLAADEDPAFLVWRNGQAITDVAVLQANLLAAVETERERRQMLVMTTGGAKKWVYAQKAAEAFDYRNIIGNLLATLTVPQRQARFPFAMAEVTGADTLAIVIARFEAGIAASRTEAARIEAVAQKGKRAIKAAATAATKQAAFNSIAWTAA